jgi:hypothetical protein
MEPAPARADRSFPLAFGLCAAAALVPIWSVKYLPMVDLPQHAVQVAAWLHLGDPAMGFADRYELHPFVPYLLPYALAVALAKVLGLMPALKVLVSLAALGLPLATARLVRRRGGDPWWTLWCFPLAFGLPFYFGFLPFMLAVPLGILLVDEGEAYASAPTAGRGLAVAALGLTVFFCHLLVLLPALGAVAPTVLLRARGTGRGILRLAPLAPAALAAVGWVSVAAASDSRVQEWIWHFSWLRLTLLPQAWFDVATWTTLEKPDIDHGAVAMTAAFTAAMALSRPRPSSDLAHWVPLGVVGAAYLLGPSVGFHSFFVAERMSCLLIPLALAAQRENPVIDRRAPRAIAVVGAVAWMAVLTVRFSGFDREMAVVERVWRHMEPNHRIATLVYQPESKSVRTTAAFLHAAAWAHVEKGGTLDSSFAHFSNMPIQYRPGRKPERTEGVELNPEGFDWTTDGAADYFLVKSPPAQYALTSPPVPLVLVAREGDWRLFRRLAPPTGAGGR